MPLPMLPANLGLAERRYPRCADTAACFAHPAMPARKEAWIGSRKYRNSTLKSLSGTDSKLSRCRVSGSIINDDHFWNVFATREDER